MLTHEGILSRRRTEDYIRQGRIQVNGRQCELGQLIDPKKDRVAIDGTAVVFTKKKEYIYIALNKPRGYITTTSDELGRRSVMELLQGINHRVYPVGRLDRNSEGLLLFTNDGELANRLMHPSSNITKLYRVTVNSAPTEQQLVDLSVDMDIGEGDRVRGANVVVLSTAAQRTVLQMTISEGKKRQIRRMCEKVGLTVVRLKRIAEGPIKLGMLKSGTFRHLTKEELLALRNITRVKR